MSKSLTDFVPDSLPLTIREHIQTGEVTDKSCSKLATTLYVNQTIPVFLKIGAKGSLEREMNMSQFLYRYELGPKIIAYSSSETHDYLLTEALPGENGTSPRHLRDPEELAAAFGRYLQKLHSLPTDGCPFPQRTQEMWEEARRRGAELEGLMALPYSPKDNVVIHGDYCLPNIIMDRFSLRAFIDLGAGGIGDRHHDLYWGLWTLHYNLQTNAYQEIFLNAYGIHDVDPEGLIYFGELNRLLE
ncbi:aminoglycoside 3'-phosphotransferase [Paenibacillus senegalensis]|uniref:aminoglycoside 3'-phosphotransferase n=1 Tax=Paenibacillus senegalensis TaxID=1465766 RepID=UPI00028917EB|nr:aminoglycoside 3'-phosphotransferase [Paenibacillus senegalensis]